MTSRMVFGSFVMMFVLTLPATAGGKGELQQYFNEASINVKATDDPSEKRRILDEALQTMAQALDIVQMSPSMSKEEEAGLHQFKSMLREKQDELEGINGFVRVPDGQLNAFSDYIVQDMEQADELITISAVTLLLIIIIIILLV